MALLTIQKSFGSLTMPLTAWPTLDRLAGASATEAVFTIVDGPLAGGRIVIGGVNLAYDGQELPASGSITSITVQQPGDFATLSVLNGMTRSAATLRSAADLASVMIHGADTMNGGVDADRLSGGAGNDRMDGGAGDDHLDGGKGADTLLGGVGRDVLLGGTSNDLLVGGAGRDVMRGGTGNDVFRIDDAIEVLQGEILDGGDGIDTLLVAYSGADSAWLSNAQLLGIEAIRFAGSGGVVLDADQLARIERIELAWGGDAAARLGLDGGGDFALDGFEIVGDAAKRLRVRIVENDEPTDVYGRGEAVGFADDDVSGSSGADRAYLAAGDDRFAGGYGQDLGLGEEGADTLDGGAGDDQLDGGLGADSLAGGAGNDIVAGDDGHDTIEGGEGDDTISGDFYTQSGNDLLTGGAGADELDGIRGADTLVGGTGNDLFLNVGADDVVTEADDAAGGIDTVHATADHTLAAGFEHLNLYAGATTGIGNAANNLIRGDGWAETLRGEAGADTLHGSSGADELWGGSGADRFLYYGVSDSGTAASTRDGIRDFNRAAGDRIDLSELDANQTTVGNDEFTSFAAYGVLESVAPGSIRWSILGDGSTLIRVYTDEDASSDMTIQVFGMGQAQQGDFIL